MKTRVILLFALWSSTVIFAQSDSAMTEKEAIKKTIDNMFDGMRAGDSAQVHSVFRDDVRMLTTFKRKTGEEVLHEGSLTDFLKAVGTPHKDVWDEKLTSMTIQVDDNIAQVWTDYSFYAGEVFSHCGVNAFQLVKQNGTWKIIQIMDTRRKVGCKE